MEFRRFPVCTLYMGKLTTYRCVENLFSFFVFFAIVSYRFVKTAGFFFAIVLFYPLWPSGYDAWLPSMNPQV